MAGPNRCRIKPGDVCWRPPTCDPYQFVCDPCVDLTDPVDVAVFEAAWPIAVSYVYQRTGCQWPGACFVERSRPCIPKCRCPCPSKCGCGSYNYLSLTEADFCLPVVEVIAVNVNGGDCCPCNETGVLRPCDDQIRLSWAGGEQRLVRQQTEGCCPSWWPTQDLCRPDGGDCTWSVDVRTGVDPPLHVLSATAALTVEIIKECRSKGCTLPDGARSVTTRGVSFERDPNDLGTGFWWSMLSDIIEAEAGHVVEQFWAPPTSCSTEWEHVFGPSRYVIKDCQVVPDCDDGNVWGVPLCGRVDCCTNVRCPNNSPCGCSDGEKAAAAIAFAAIP